MFIVKEVANDLGITPQAIYNQKEELIQKGYMQKNTSGDWEVTADGYNYLKERRINKIKQRNANLRQIDNKNIDNSNKNYDFGLNETLTHFYENRIEEIKQSYENQLKEQKQQVEYFKNLYEAEKNERIKVNNQYQSYLLGTAEDNKRHWWKFWDKDNK